MGFTRYWTRPRIFDPDRFAAFSADCKKACAAVDVPLINKVFDGNEVRFDMDPPYETFLVQQESHKDPKDGDQVLEFCKTAKKPYDTVVVACLDLMHEYFPEVKVDCD